MKEMCDTQKLSLWHNRPPTYPNITLPQSDSVAECLLTNISDTVIVEYLLLLIIIVEHLLLNIVIEKICLSSSVPHSPALIYLHFKEDKVLINPLNCRFVDRDDRLVFRLRNFNNG